jgi:hypothetical protein
MENEQQFAVGDRVQLRRFKRTQGTVWSIEPDKITRRGMVTIVKWNDPDENAYIRDTSELEKVTARGARPALAGRRRRAPRARRRTAGSRA